jgi:tetratricopeptide (TPR) repeat protein
LASLLDSSVVARSSAAPAPPTKTVTKPALLPEDHLARAIAALTPAARARHAKQGLACRAPLERTTHALLLRQLYVAYYEGRKFRKAHEIALQVLELRVMVDVAHQDAARSAMALGLTDEAVGHLRLASRRGPASRRAFHLWTLGSTLYLVGRHTEAVGCLDRAARWGTTDKVLYQAHAAVARLAGGEHVGGAKLLLDRLEKAPSGQGYGRFVLGQLAFHLRRWDDSKRHLEAFLKRTSEARPALALSLAGEVASAQATLEKMRSN